MEMTQYQEATYYLASYVIPELPYKVPSTFPASYHQGEPSLVLFPLFHYVWACVVEWQCLSPFLFGRASSTLAMYLEFFAIPPVLHAMAMLWHKQCELLFGQLVKHNYPCY